jgi:hypothetical protein
VNVNRGWIKREGTLRENLRIAKGKLIVKPKDTNEREEP